MANLVTHGGVMAARMKVATLACSKDRPWLFSAESGAYLPILRYAPAGTRQNPKVALGSVFMLYGEGPVRHDYLSCHRHFWTKPLGPYMFLGEDRFLSETLCDLINNSMSSFRVMPNGSKSTNNENETHDSIDGHRVYQTFGYRLTLSYATISSFRRNGWKVAEHYGVPIDDLALSASTLR